MTSKYKLKRLPDVDNKLNWELTPFEKTNNLIIYWSRASIEKEVKEMKVGETKIL